MGRLRGTTDLFRMRTIGTTSLYVSAVVATAVPGTLLLAEWTSISIDSMTLTDTHTECTDKHVRKWVSAIVSQRIIYAWVLRRV